MTRFKNILKQTNRPDEQLILMKKKFKQEEDVQIIRDELGLPIKDELGLPIEEYEPVKELHGIIQAGQSLDIDFHGQEAQVNYVAYLMPEFDLERENLNEYRIKYIRPYETMILKIMSYNPNLFLRHKRHHVKMGLILEKKYGG
jgi:hypothetical protein